MFWAVPSVICHIFPVEHQSIPVLLQLDNRLKFTQFQLLLKNPISDSSVRWHCVIFWCSHLVSYIFWRSFYSIQSVKLFEIVIIVCNRKYHQCRQFILVFCWKNCIFLTNEYCFIVLLMLFVIYPVYFELQKSDDFNHLTYSSLLFHYHFLCVMYHCYLQILLLKLKVNFLFLEKFGTYCDFYR